jgi:hypothetical protein
MPGGMFLGTCSGTQPGPGYATPRNIDVSQVESTGLYQGYMLEDTYVASTFDGIPTGSNCWGWTTCSYAFSFLCAGDVNAADGGNASDPYVIIQICQDTPTSLLYQPHLYLDEISISIY